MKLTGKQFLLLCAILVIGAQAPMFALASSIDNDEAAKSALGIIAAAVFTGVFAALKWRRRE